MRTPLLITIASTLLLASGMHAAENHASQRYVLKNGFALLSGAGGSFDRFQIDPDGKGNYGENWIRTLRIGEVLPQSAQSPKWELAGSILKLSGVSARIAISREIDVKSIPHRLAPGGRLGMRFRVNWDGFTRASGFFPTWDSPKSGLTMTLRRDGPEGTVVSRKSFRNIKDNGEVGIEFASQPAGLYYIEISDPIGTPGWWGRDERVTEEETGFVNGKPAQAAFRTHLEGYKLASVDWELSLDGNKLSWKVKEPQGVRTPVRLVTPWIKSGYVTADSKIVFSRFFTDRGIYRPVHQFKRKQGQGLSSAQWIRMTGTQGFDLRFANPLGIGINWEMAEDEMEYVFDKSELGIEMLPHSDALPDSFPAFFSSNPEMDAVLNQFLYSHAYNFGVGCPPDWKEWQTRILCWSKSPQVSEQAGHLTSYAMRPDGYVYAWGGEEGWPFPFKDDDKDGKNDYDTRHFTTNPCYILGCANHALWSRDRGFVETVLPRARKAMEYELNQLQGAKGIIITDAEGHTGKNGGIGSNYWDILPFGHKDAFSNSYYYASLEAMAELEELGSQMGLPKGERSPAFYRELRNTVRADYQASFWDQKAGRFVGCVDVDGAKHDYGFTFVNMEAMTYGLADLDQVKRIYHWMETERTTTGKPDTYSQWIFAPRATTVWNPGKHSPKSETPSWWFFGWDGAPFGDQCQDGGAILYTSYYDIMARARYLGAENAFDRFQAILDRYAMPDHLSGGNLLCRGEHTQGGGEGAGSIGVEGEFPESGLVPASFLYAFLGVEPKAEGLTIRPNLPSSLKFAGVRNLSYHGKTYEIRVTSDSVFVRRTDPGSAFAVRKSLKPGEVFVLDRYL